MWKEVKETIRYKILIILAAVLFFLLFDHLGFFEGMNHYLYDLSFRLRGPRPYLRNIVLITIQRGTLEKLGRWPLRRHYYASLLERLTQAEIVVFDITMHEPTEEDHLLATAIARHERILLPFHFDSKMSPVYPAHTLSSPYRIGHTHLEQGIDGIVREVYHTLLYQKLLFPSISSMVYEAVTRSPFRRMAQPPSDQEDKGIIQLDGMLINYCGPPGTFEMVSFSDVLDGVYPATFFKGKIALVGVSAIGLGDQWLTPFSQHRKNMSGIELQANIVNTLLNNNSIQEISPWVRSPLILMLSLFSFICFLRTSEKKAALWGLAILLLITVSFYLFFSELNLWLPPAIFYMTTLSIFLITYVMKLEDSVKNLDRAYAMMLPQLRWRQKEGKEKEVGWGVSAILTPGGIQSRVRILADVGNQLTFEKELADRALFSNIHGVLLFGPDGKNLMSNDFAMAWCQSNSMDITSVEKFLKGIHPHLLEEVDLEHSLRVPDLYKRHVTAMISLPFPERKYFKLDVSSIHVFDGDYLLFILSDVTEIKELEILKGQIILQVSHELKTPMTSIQGFSEILSRNLQGKEKTFAGVIYEESRRMSRFLNIFLDITRIESGRQPLRFTPVALTNLIQEVVFNLAPEAKKKEMTLLTEFPDEMKPVTIDKDLTKQCLLNLIENAIKYSPPKSDVLVRIAEEADQVRIDVVDQGYGIPEEELSKIFEMFYRSSSRHTETIQGSGIGLTFVKQAIEVQGGKVSVVSVLGRGTTFSIILSRKT